MYLEILLLLPFVSIINVIYWLNSGCVCEFYSKEGNIQAVKLYLKCRYLGVFFIINMIIKVNRSSRKHYILPIANTIILMYYKDLV